MVFFQSHPLQYRVDLNILAWDDNILSSCVSTRKVFLYLNPNHFPNTETEKQVGESNQTEVRNFFNFYYSLLTSLRLNGTKYSLLYSVVQGVFKDCYRIMCYSESLLLSSEFILFPDRISNLL